MTVDQTNQSEERIERRDANTPRVQYEALVEVGAGSTGGFEAESVDVSVDGIRLRTAYLPQPGEALVCRFNGYGGEIVAEGQVSWCRQEGRGGEFGVRFTNLDAYGAQLLEAICRPAEPEEVTADGAALGSRVRMHIDGLGSPMRARVRDVAQGEVLIGSNLEFLRVGRDVELEELEGGSKRTAQIEHVGVDIDPETHVPQLVVALRYEGMGFARADAPVDTPIYEGHNRPDSYQSAPQAVRADGTPEPAVIDAYPNATNHQDVYSATPVYQRHVDTYAAGSMPASHAPAAYAPAPSTHASPQLDERAAEAEDSGRESLGRTSLADLQDHEPAPDFGSRLRDVASRVGPPLASMGRGAKGALGAILRTVRDKREAQGVKGTERAKGNGPKRTTAPPPSGALRSDGRRLFREQVEAEHRNRRRESQATPDRKRAVFGAVLGVLSVIAIYAVADRLSGDDQGSGKAVAAAAGVPNTPLAGAPGAPPQPGAVGAGQGNGAAAPPGAPVATANVPLFGATPLSTTEPVPPAPGEAALPEPGAGDREDVPTEPRADDALELDRNWGVGVVDDPTVIRLKMDGKIAGVAGAEGATGFTVVLPGRKSISSAAGLARKDRRIDSVNVVNYPDRAEVTFHFKGDIPPFLVKARGKRLIVELGQAKKKKKKRKKNKAKKKKKKKKKKGKRRAKKKPKKKKRKKS